MSLPFNFLTSDFHFPHVQQSTHDTYMLLFLLPLVEYNNMMGFMFLFRCINSRIMFYSLLASEDQSWDNYILSTQTYGVLRYFKCINSSTMLPLCSLARIILFHPLISVSFVSTHHYAKKSFLLLVAFMYHAVLLHPTIVCMCKQKWLSFNIRLINHDKHYEFSSHIRSLSCSYPQFKLNRSQNQKSLQYFSCIS